jgi:hypothetical protein
MRARPHSSAASMRFMRSRPCSGSCRVGSSRAMPLSCANISRLAKRRAGLPRSRWQILLGHLGEGFGRKTPLTVAHRSVRRQLAAGELGGSPADQPLSLGQGEHAGSLPSFDPGTRSRAEGPAVLAKIAGSDAPSAQGSKIASVRTSIDSRGAASVGVSGNSKALCGVKRARSPRLSQPLISRTSSRSIFGA